jgi:hypothetical protein
MKSNAVLEALKAINEGGSVDEDMTFSKLVQNVKLLGYKIDPKKDDQDRYKLISKTGRAFFLEYEPENDSVGIQDPKTGAWLRDSDVGKVTGIMPTLKYLKKMAGGNIDDSVDSSLDESKSYTLKREAKTKAAEFKAGDKGDVEWYKDKNSYYMGRFTASDGRTFVFQAKNAWKYLGTMKEPSVSTLEKWENDGYCKTVTGARTEPDGEGPDGAPSWLLAMGMI